MLLVLTIALAIAGVHAEMAVEHLAPSVAKANPPQWVTAVAIVAKTNAIVALAIAKALVMAAVFLVLRDKLSLGWEVLTLCTSQPFKHKQLWLKNLHRFACCCFVW